MSLTSRRKLVIRSFLITGVIWVLLQFPLSLISHVLGHSGGDYYPLLMLVLATLGYVLLGATIIDRQPENRIGWLFVALGIVLALWSNSQAYAVYTLTVHKGALPFGVFVGWVEHWSLAASLVLFIPIFLLFPDGRLPSRRWRPVMWVWALGSAVAVIGFALDQTKIVIGNGTCGAALETGNATACMRNPIHIGGVSHLIATVTGFGGLATGATAVAACVAVVRRFRRAQGDERQQTKWLAFVGVAFGVTFALNMIFLGNITEDSSLTWIANLGFIVSATLLLLGLPAACGVAILKYHLYDLDIVVRKTVVFGALAIFITAVYILIVAGIGAIVGHTNNSVLSFVGAAVVAVAFQPARERARRFADRVVYGRRATPYEVLSEFSGNVGETYATDDVLPRMAQILATGTGAASARVLLRVGGELRDAASFGDDKAGEEHVVPVTDRGEDLGALAVTMPASDPMDGTKEKLVRDLAAQAGLVLRNVKLIEELRASRQRLVKAQDEERRKLERNIHDGAQQQLVALAVKLRLAENTASKEEAVATREQLATLQQDANDALENLRDLARGIYPPLLADKGLAAALESQTRRSPWPVTIEADGVGRFSPDVEAAIYFCALEALNNAAKYADASRAEISLSQRDGLVTFTVGDDGMGFDAGAKAYGTGMQGMRDRLDAIGGTLAVKSEPGHGTTVTGAVPVGSA
ncbi:MAG: sensor histidine kinase [Actinomycetota bacterium]|nr:sensor histidine kinase [Actinomycetota bacterium]